MSDKRAEQLADLQAFFSENREAFADDFSDLTASAEELRAFIAETDKILFDFFANPPENADDVERFIERHIAAIESVSPAAKAALKNMLAGIAFVCTSGPLVHVRSKLGGVVKFCVGEHLLFCRNIMAFYVGDPLKIEDDYKNPPQSAN